MIIFDCDGVLVESELLSNAVDAEALAAHGYSVRPEQLIARFLGRTKMDMYAEIFAELGRPVPQDFVEGVYATTLERYRTHLRAVDGVAGAIAAISGRRCVASSRTIAKLRLGLEVTGLLPLFDPNVFSADQVARGKPAPDLFLLAASTMGCEPDDCIVIEDSVAGVTAARAAGMTAIGFTGGSHMSDGSARRLREAGAAAICVHMSGLPTTVAALRAALA